MSHNSSFNESPNHFMVLGAVARGTDKVDKIARDTKLNNAEIQLILNDLIHQRLVTKIEKRGILGRKKITFLITDTGIKLLNSKKDELKRTANEMHNLYNSGNKTQLQGVMNSNRSWMPFLLFSGLMDILFFTSMMSFMGMAMNPGENAMTEEAGGGGGEDSGAGAESSGDVGATEMGSEGFDLGGFGDF